MANVTKAQLAIMLTTGFAVAFMGWAVVYLASPPDRVTRSRFRRWLQRVASVADGPRMTQPWPWIRLAAVGYRVAGKCADAPASQRTRL